VTFIRQQRNIVIIMFKVILIAAIVIIIGAGAFYLASPLFISSEIDEPLPEGAELSTLPSSSTSEPFREFVAMSEEERIEASNQMSEEEKNQIMLEFSRMNSSSGGINESMEELQISEGENVTNGTSLTGSFIGAGDGYIMHRETQKLFLLKAEVTFLDLRT
jgi:hypothetical protein